MGLAPYYFLLFKKYYSILDTALNGYIKQFCCLMVMDADIYLFSEEDWLRNLFNSA